MRAHEFKSAEMMARNGERESVTMSLLIHFRAMAIGDTGDGRGEVVVVVAVGHENYTDSDRTTRTTEGQQRVSVSAAHQSGQHKGRQAGSVSPSCHQLINPIFTEQQQHNLTSILRLLAKVAKVKRWSDILDDHKKRQMTNKQTDRQRGCPHSSSAPVDRQSSLS